MSADTLLIVGASARAAAMSARRAGFSPWCADLFADADLRAICPVTVRCPVDQYPLGFLEILKSAPQAPWIYTGGLENYPELVRSMSALRPLWGNNADSLVLARSPFAIARSLRRAGLPALEVCSTDAHLPASCRWLRKPLAGSAGHGIGFAESSGAGGSSGSYFQHYVEGTPVSAVFVRAGGRVTRLGVTEQLIGTPWLNAPPFRYAGNIGPLDLPAGAMNRIDQIGTVIGESCKLLGLFGVDFVLEGDTPWVVEVNPRYPASVEVLEAATGVRCLTRHRSVFDGSIGELETQRSKGATHGKAILYSATRIRITVDVSDRLLAEPSHHADIPCGGEVIERGWPILTVRAQGRSRDECLASLRERVAAARRLVGGSGL